VRLSELSARAGVPVATVKYYLREGLLPAGERVSATAADYADVHVERVRLIRALVDGAGMSIAGVRRVVEAIEHPPSSWHDFLGAAQAAISDDAPQPPDCDRARYAVEQLGWGDSAHPHTVALLQSALNTADRAGFPVPADRLVAYGSVMERVAEIDLESLVTDTEGQGPSAALRHVAVGTVVVDPVLVALRRLAQAHLSAARFGVKS